MKNALNWFEIPVKNISTAKKFYETILGTEMPLMEAMGMKSAFFPADIEQGKVGGCIVEGQGYEPNINGSVIYLNANDDLNNVLNKVEAAGGKILLPKTAIGANGFMAHFSDTEGNKIGLHSNK